MSEADAKNSGPSDVGTFARNVRPSQAHGSPRSVPLHSRPVPQSGTRLLARSFQGREEPGAFPQRKKRRRATREPATSTEPSDPGEKRPVRVSRCDTLFRGLVMNALTGLERPAYDSAAALRHRRSERRVSPPHA